jgi:hypothetical protein
MNQFAGFAATKDHGESNLDHGKPIQANPKGRPEARPQGQDCKDHKSPENGPSPGEPFDPETGQPFDSANR